MHQHNALQSSSKNNSMCYERIYGQSDNPLRQLGRQLAEIYQPPSYGIKQQFTVPEDHSKPLSTADVNKLHMRYRPYLHE